jgi:RHS repeat-associated protein
VSYSYNANGSRVTKTVGSTTTWYIYGLGGELVAEYPANGAPSTPQKEYGYRGGQMLLVYDSTETGNKQFQWLVQDHLGSTRMVVDLSGSLTGMKRHDYLPFGEELGAGVGIRTAGQGYVGDQVRQKFTGYERDVETGLDYAQARMLSGSQGRFTSVDPIGVTVKRMIDPQQINMYAYTRNNPLAYVDPTGMDSESEDEKRKRLEAQLAAEKAKIAQLPEGSDYNIALLGINSPQPNTPTAQAILDPQNAGVLAEAGLSSVTAANTSILPNDNGAVQASALPGVGNNVNQAQLNMATQLAQAAIDAKLKVNIIAHSNGNQTAAALFDTVPKLQAASTIAIAPNTNQLSDLTTMGTRSGNYTLVSSNRDERLSTPGAANIRMEKAVGNLKYGAGLNGPNYRYIQTNQTGHGAQHYFRELRGQGGPVKVYR